MKRLFWFMVAGAIGFLADATMLWMLLHASSLGPLSARLLAISFALAVTYGFNRSVTFGRSRFPLLLEGARYGGVGLGSAGLNYGIYVLLLTLVPGMSPLLSMVAASAAAMVFSFVGYSRFVFGK